MLVGQSISAIPTSEWQSRSQRWQTQILQPLNQNISPKFQDNNRVFIFKEIQNWHPS